MKYCLFIPSTPEHFKNVDLILEMYKNGTEQPDEIIVSLSKSYEVNNELIDNIEKKYNCNIIRHDTIKLAGPNRQCAINATSDVIIYHDSDDYPHHQRIEIIKHFFETYDIVHLNHDYLFKSEYEKHKNNNIDINNIKYLA